MLVTSMKAKQTTEQKHCTKLRKLIADFKDSYLAKKAEVKAKTKAPAK